MDFILLDVEAVIKLISNLSGGGAEERPEIVAGKLHRSQSADEAGGEDQDDSEFA